MCKWVDSGSERLHVLSDLSLTIKAGESCAIVGASGSGKTTLLSILAGLDLPSAGALALAGEDLLAMTEDERTQFRAQHIGFVFQSFQLLPALTALENLTVPARLLGLPDDPAKFEALLDDVGLSHRKHHYPQQLSGGEQQRVAIARAFIGEPALLFADEPTGNLDSDNGRQIADRMFEVNARHGATLVLVTHDMELARRCDRVVRIDGGRLVTNEVAP